MISNIISIISSWALTLIDKTGYVGVFVLSLVESAGIPVPSEVVLPFSGFLAYSGRFSFVAVVIIATLANYFGSVILFLIGKSGGRWLIEKYGRFLLISRHDLEIGDKWFYKHGAKVAFWGRLLPVVRTFISLPAGMARMDFRKFSIYTLAGAFPWNFLLAYIGFKAGANWDMLRAYFHRADYAIVGLLIVLLFWFLYKKYEQRKAASI